MQSSRNIIKRLAIGRCPPPALGRMPVQDAAPQNGRLFVHARLANCCRKLYTRLFGRSRETVLMQALATRRRKYNMSWLKTALRLKVPDAAACTAAATITDTLSMPLKDCHELQPQSICAASPPDLTRSYYTQSAKKYRRPSSLYNKVRIQSLVIRAKAL